MSRRLFYKYYRSFTGTWFRLTQRVTKTGVLMVAAAFVAAGLGLDTYLSVSYQTFTILFLLLIAAVVSTFFVRVKLTIERILPRFGSVGQHVSYPVLVRNTGRHPQRGLSLMEELEDPRPTLDQYLHSPDPEEHRRNWLDRWQGWYRWQWLVSKNRQAAIEETLLPTISPDGTAEVTMQIVPLRRGVIRLPGVMAAAPDVFGLFRVLKRIPSPQSMLILPKRYAIAPIDLPGRTKYQQGGVAMASSVGESEEFVSLRDYRPGDPLRHIHWRSFAKVGEPIVKEFQDEFFVRHALILDTFEVPEHSDVFEEAVSVAASFAYTIQTQDSLLDLMFVGPEAYCFTAGRGLAHMEQMLEVLAAVQPCHDRPFASLRQLVIEHVGAVSGCICIFLAWDEQRQNFVEHLKVLGIPMLVFVVVNGDAALSPGPMSDTPVNFRVLPVGKVGEELAKL